MAMRRRGGGRSFSSDSYVSLPFGLIGAALLIGGLGYGVWFVIKGANTRAEHEVKVSAGTSGSKTQPSRPVPSRPKPSTPSGPKDPPFVKPSVAKALV